MKTTKHPPKTVKGPQKVHIGNNGTPPIETLKKMPGFVRGPQKVRIGNEG